MKRNSEIEKELEAISPVVAKINNDTIFQTPAGYFEGLSEKILNLAKKGNEPIDIGVNVLPSQEETNQLSPLIGGLKSKTTFSIPDGYFQTLPQTIIAKLTEPKVESPVYHINTTNNNSKLRWLRYAIAASVLGFITLSVFFIRNNNNTSSAISKVSIIEKQSVANHLPEISDVDLSTYLSATTENPLWLLDNTSPDLDDIVFLKMDDMNLGNTLKDIPDEILTAYEEETLTIDRILL